MADKYEVIAYVLSEIKKARSNGIKQVEVRASDMHFALGYGHHFHVFGQENGQENGQETGLRKGFDFALYSIILLADQLLTPAIGNISPIPKG